MSNTACDRNAYLCTTDLLNFCFGPVEQIFSANVKSLSLVCMYFTSLYFLLKMGKSFKGGKLYYRLVLVCGPYFECDMKIKYSKFIKQQCYHKLQIYFNVLKATHP